MLRCEITDVSQGKSDSIYRLEFDFAIEDTTAPSKCQQLHIQRHSTAVIITDVAQ